MLRKKQLYLAQENMIRLIARTGIPKGLLPQRVRRSLKYIVRNITLRVMAPFDVMGHRMYLDPHFLGSTQMIRGTYERETVEAFRKILKPGMTVVDVGAHVGFFTLLAARLVGRGGMVYAFEPNPQVFELLTRNIQENGYQDIVRAIPKAVSNRRDKRRLFVSKFDSGMSSFYPSLCATEDSLEVEVETVSLDGFIAEQGWPKIDLVKLDVEGSEVECIEGMRHVIQQNQEIKLIVEFSPESISRSYGSPENLFEMLMGLGCGKFYSIQRVLKEVRIPDDLHELIRVAEATPGRYINLLCEW